MESGVVALVIAVDDTPLICPPDEPPGLSYIHSCPLKIRGVFFYEACRGLYWSSPDKPFYLKVIIGLLLDEKNLISFINAQLSENIFYMAIYSMNGQAELLGNFPIGKAGKDMKSRLLLPGRQAFRFK